MDQHDIDVWHMTRALELAALGEGHVEPNPMVGSIVAQGAEIVGEGWHGRFGGPHAEVEALAIAGRRARGATLYVTLEPCCHHGKTPPCTDAILAAGISRVVVAQRDPFPKVAGQGLEILQRSGIEVVSGLLEEEARRLNAPYLKRLEQGLPWVIAKWAMTLDGKIASRSGNSQWISNETSRAIVHRLRGRVDAVLVGIGTALADDPLLTARPPEPVTNARIATRIVLDSRARLPIESKLVRSARETPLIVAVGETSSPQDREQLSSAGAEVLVCPGSSHDERTLNLLRELASRGMTNVLVEGGAKIFGSLFDQRFIDELHVFVAPRLIGGKEAASPVAGLGLDSMQDALRLDRPTVRNLDGDLYLSGRIAK